MSAPSQIRFLQLSGSPRERGWRQGELLAQEIRVMRRAALKYLALVTFWAGTLPLYAFLSALCRRFWPYLGPDLREELQSLAVGARLPLATVLLINSLDDLANNLPACSALAVGERKTASGFYLAGRNLDYPLFTEELLKLQTLFLVSPERGLAFVSLAWPGYIGVSTGLNRAGVVLAQLAARSRDTTLKGMPAALRYRQALETGDSVTAVARRVLEVPGTIGNNLLLASPREALVLELSSRRFSVRRPVAGVLTVTNHYQSPAMAQVKGAFPRRPPFAKIPASHFTEDYSISRYVWLQKLADRDLLGVRELQEILGHPRIANPGTVNSVVFDPAHLTLWVATHDTTPVSQGQFIKFEPWKQDLPQI